MLGYHIIPMHSKLTYFTRLALLSTDMNIFLKHNLCMSSNSISFKVLSVGSHQERRWLAPYLNTSGLSPVVFIWTFSARLREHLVPPSFSSSRYFCTESYSLLNLLNGLCNAVLFAERTYQHEGIAKERQQELLTSVQRILEAFTSRKISETLAFGISMVTAKTISS